MRPLLPFATLLGTAFLLGPDGSRMTLPDYQWLRETIESEEGQAKVQKAAELGGIAKELGISMAQMAIAWCLANPNVSTVILGASSVPQLKENLDSLSKLPLLTADVMQRIEGVLQNKPELPTQF